MPTVHRNRPPVVQHPHPDGHKTKERKEAQKHVVKDLRAEYNKDGFTAKERNQLNAARNDPTGKTAAVQLELARAKDAEKALLTEMKNTLSSDGVFSAADKALLQQARTAFKTAEGHLVEETKREVQKNGIAHASLPDPIAWLRRVADRVLTGRVVDTPAPTTPPPPSTA